MFFADADAETMLKQARPHFNLLPWNEVLLLWHHFSMNISKNIENLLLMFFLSLAQLLYLYVLKTKKYV